MGHEARAGRTRKRGGKAELSRSGQPAAPVPPAPSPGDFRSGIGTDIHRLVAGRPLVIGGVHIPFDKGPEGHSDGDVLAHAICDALLGAAHLGDIGRHFPNHDPKWKDAASLLFLERVRELLGAAGYRIVNVDASVHLERPKLAPHIPEMEKQVATALGLEPGQVSVKAKTGEGMDAVGRGEAIQACAVALLASQPAAVDTLAGRSL